MRRRVLRFVTAVSFVMLVLIGLDWVRSYWWMDEFNRVSTSGSNVVLTGFATASGQLSTSRNWTDASVLQETALVGPGHHTTPLARDVNFAGWVDTLREFTPSGAKVLVSFRVASCAVHVNRCNQGLEWMIAVPHWIPFLVAAILPLLALFRWFRARRLTPLGKCPQCRGELWINGTNCPICGAPTPEVTTPPTAPLTQ